MDGLEEVLKKKRESFYADFDHDCLVEEADRLKQENESLETRLMIAITALENFAALSVRASDTKGYAQLAINEAK